VSVTDLRDRSAALLGGLAITPPVRQRLRAVLELPG
jgi:hypothetical protein